MGHIRRNILYLTAVCATLHLHIVMAGMHTDRSDEECDQVRTKVIAYEGENEAVISFSYFRDVYCFDHAFHLGSPLILNAI